ncbi:hypothetical protein CC78DRAFT_615755 [Lojkania enalia]|uniref:Uncharacterized protein n=1 Tax=Lojkania enalia TaxID=147567 RepID=A0A9P4N134_9PLEO|nr:hypothetical protein CC78DRAFT_615755 [Didymosphaeria enalia]
MKLYPLLAVIVVRAALTSGVAGLAVLVTHDSMPTIQSKMNIYATGPSLTPFRHSSGNRPTMAAQSCKENGHPVNTALNHNDHWILLSNAAIAITSAADECRDSDRELDRMRQDVNPLLHPEAKFQQFPLMEQSSAAIIEFC